MANIGLISLYGVENTGVRLLASVLRRKNFNVYLIFFKRWVNNDIRFPSDEEKKILLFLLRELKVDIVGVSFISPFLKIAQDITTFIKNNLKIKVVWGGIHATVKPEECLEYCDIVCRGEGEYAMLDIARSHTNGFSPKGIKNTCYKMGEKIVFEEMRPLIQNLDSLPFHDYGGNNKFFIEGKLKNIDPLNNARELRFFASRGCPFNCSYCYNSILRRIYRNEKYHRIRSVESTISEIGHTLSKLEKIKKIKFDDDTFVFPKQWINEFCKKYKSQIGLPFEILFNPGSFDKEILKKLKGAGLKRIQVGIQTGSEKESETVYNRRLPRENIRRFASISKNLKLDVVYDIIFDNPLSTSKDKEKLIELLLSLPRPFNLFFYSLTIFPGTELCEMLLRKGLINPQDVEGETVKSFHQFRLSFSYPRAKEELFVICVISLISKSFIPKFLIFPLQKSKFFKKHPLLLKWFAQICNWIKLLQILLKMVISKEINIWKFKEYGSPKRFLIQ